MQHATEGSLQRVSSSVACLPMSSDPAAATSSLQPAATVGRKLQGLHVLEAAAEAAAQADANIHDASESRCERDAAAFAEEGRSHHHECIAALSANL